MIPWWHPRRAGRQRRPWPLENLVAAAGSETELFRTLRLSGRDIANVRAWGLTDRQADVWACKLGLHPGMVWPRWFSIYDDRAALLESVRDGRERRNARIDTRAAGIHARANARRWTVAA